LKLLITKMIVSQYDTFRKEIVSRDTILELRGAAQCT
jgi:hypothetical protein